MAWHHEQYVLLHRAQAERTRDVLSDLRLHILPTFGGLLETDVESGRNALITWTRTMAGYPLTPGGTVDENVPSYARDNVNGMLWIISEVLLYAHTMGAPVPVVASMVASSPQLPTVSRRCSRGIVPSAKHDSCRSPRPGPWPLKCT